MSQDQQTDSAAQATAQSQTTNSTADSSQITDTNAATAAAEDGSQAHAQQPDGGKKTETGQEQQGDAKTSVAPEKYEFSQPEGAAIDPGDIAVFSEVAREIGLTQDAAQKVLDKMAPQIQKRQLALHAATTRKWAEDSRADNEIGGENFDANLAVSKTALEKWGTPELNKFLVESGLGNHPEMIRLFHRIGIETGEDTFVGGKAAASQKPKSIAERMFPNMNP